MRGLLETEQTKTKSVFSLFWAIYYNRRSPMFTVTSFSDSPSTKNSLGLNCCLYNPISPSHTPRSGRLQSQLLPTRTAPSGRTQLPKAAWSREQRVLHHWNCSCRVTEQSLNPSFLHHHHLKYLQCEKCL